MNKVKDLIRTTLPGWCGLAALAGSFLILRHRHLPSYIQAYIIIGILFGTMFCVEAFLCIRGKYGLIGASCKRRLDFTRVFYKFIGWAITVFCVSSAYWVFPEYFNSSYTPYFQALNATWFYLTCFFVFCILWEDRRSDDEFDGYYWLAYALLNFKFNLLKKVNLKQHFLGWVVKLYFLPLMFIYLVSYVDYFNTARFFGRYDLFNNTIFLIDTAFVCVGYIFANNLIDTHIRSTDPTMLGWVCTLICYQPFASTTLSSYISYGTSWGIWLEAYPGIRAVWFLLIVLCWFLYIWATISFGSRFSNLTHRGILSCGPYAYLKHPAYIGKLASFFLINVPFIANDFTTTIRYCLMWGLLAGVYYLRAKTEEAHLRSIGPEYDIYTKEITQNWKRFLRLKRA